MIKDIVNKFKKENGNENFTQKDMIIYIVSKLDDMDGKFDVIQNKFEKGTGKIAENRANITSIRRILYALIPILAGVLGYIIKITH